METLSPVSPFMVMFLSQAVIQLPVFLVYLAGIILAYVFLRRYKVPCILLLVSCAINVLGTIASLVVTDTLMLYMVNYHRWTASAYSVIQAVSSLAWSFVHAISMALLLIAVLVGRKDARKEKQAAAVAVPPSA